MMTKTACLRATLLLVCAAALGCSPGEVEIELDTPEKAAQSVGRVLCAEHQSRARALVESLEETLTLQASKAELLADPTLLTQVNERLARLEELAGEEGDALTSCTVVLTDRQTEGSDTFISMKLVVSELERDDDTFALEEKAHPVLLTLTELDGAWKVTRSSVDFAMPHGALRSLLD